MGYELISLHGFLRRHGGNETVDGYNVVAFIDICYNRTVSYLNHPKKPVFREY